jgi:hypothetical protein
VEGRWRAHRTGYEAEGRSGQCSDQKRFFFFRLTIAWQCVRVPLATKFWGLIDRWMNFPTIGSTVRLEQCNGGREGSKSRIM